MLQIIVLNGDLQGTSLDLFEGFQIGVQENSDLKIENEVLSKALFSVSCNSSGNFILSSKTKKNILTVGEETVHSLDLIPGLIFSIGDIGFSIQENTEDDSGKKIPEYKKIFDAFKDVKSTSPLLGPIKILNPDLTFKFVRGILTNKTWTLPYHPISFGKKTTLFFFLDDSVPSDLDFLHLSAKAQTDGIILTSDLPNFVSLNGSPINGPKEIFDGDLVEFGGTAFYIGIK